MATNYTGYNSTSQMQWTTSAHTNTHIRAPSLMACQQDTHSELPTYKTGFWRESSLGLPMLIMTPCKFREEGPEMLLTSVQSRSTTASDPLVLALDKAKSKHRQSFNSR